MAYYGGQPVIVLKEDTERSRGRDARKSNMLAAQIIAEVLKTTLGPRGMDKMLIDSLGDITITSDGATVLDEIDVQHPAAKMMIEVAKTQDKEVGDGTTTAVLLAGELLRKAGELLEDNIHPSIIISGYQKAAERALEGVDRETLDYIIVGQNLGDVRADNIRTDMVPTIASRVKHRLRINNPYTVAMDVPFGCPGCLARRELLPSRPHTKQENGPVSW